MAGSPQCFDMPETDFSFCSGCEGCYHFLQPSGCSRHLGVGVPPRHDNDFFDGYMSGVSTVSDATNPSSLARAVNTRESMSRSGTATKSSTSVA